MITKEEFVKSIELFKQYEDFEQKMYDLGINLIDVEPLSRFCAQYTKLLSEAAGDTANWTDWWIWETQYGTNEEFCEYWLKGEDLEEPGHRVESAEQLYDIIQEDPQ